MSRKAGLYEDLKFFVQSAQRDAVEVDRDIMLIEVGLVGNLLTHQRCEGEVVDTPYDADLIIVETPLAQKWSAKACYRYDFTNPHRHRKGKWTAEQLIYTFGMGEPRKGRAVLLQGWLRNGFTLMGEAQIGRTYGGWLVRWVRE